MVSSCILYERDKVPCLLEDLMNEALHLPALLVEALLPATGRLFTLCIQQDLFQPFSRANFCCSPLAWLPKDARPMLSRAVPLGSCFMDLSRQLLSQLGQFQLNLMENRWTCECEISDLIMKANNQVEGNSREEQDLGTQVAMKSCKPTGKASAAHSMRHQRIHTQKPS